MRKRAWAEVLVWSFISFWLCESEWFSSLSHSLSLFLSVCAHLSSLCPFIEFRNGRHTVCPRTNNNKSNNDRKTVSCIFWLEACTMHTHTRNYVDCPSEFRCAAHCQYCTPETNVWNDWSFCLFSIHFDFVLEERKKNFRCEERRYFRWFSHRSIFGYHCVLSLSLALSSARRIEVRYQ